ncbi:MAG TPA: transglutaminase domain-containing protein [Abditibacteriaceae bacterium]|jgi:transglutaminase-like putative cysteine protease
MALKLAPLHRVSPRAASAPPTWEQGVRYGAAYACVLVAIAAAQLLIPTGFALILAGVALLGLPVSLGVRQHGFRIGERQYSRAAYARLVTAVTSIVVLVFLRLALPTLFGGSTYQLFVRTDTLRSIEVLMQIFLLFAVCRCFAIISDKDAVLSTVPSFSVLLLLIVAHKGPEVVSYFLMWAILTAILFALDHRGETRQGTVATVPALSPGQDITLSSRALLSVVTFSVLCAFAISNYLASKQTNERGRAENWIIALSSRLSGSGFDFSDASVNGGPERTIDFTSSLALPTRTPVWRFSVNTVSGQQRYLTPDYWRMFTLSRYDGRSWSQSPGNGRQILPAPFARQDWPILVDTWGIRRQRREISQDQLQRRSERYPGFSLAREFPQTLQDYGAPRSLVRSMVAPLITTTGYMPLLPVARAVKFRTERPNGVRLRADRALEVGVLNRFEQVETLSEMPPVAEYGGVGRPPLKRGERPNPAATLSAAERAEYLKVSTTTPQRVRDWAGSITRGASATDNDFRRAQRLTVAIRNRGTYTLRPPLAPEDRDAVDYFLFESRRGYCTYFASALTIACRTQGIPARIVSGFVNPSYFSDINGRVWGVAIEANAHAWTEVWVDGWGWAVLDATPADDRGDNAPGLWDGIGDSIATTGITIRTWVLANRLPLIFASIALVSFLLFARRGAFSWILAVRRDWKLRRAAQGAARENDLARARIIEAYRQSEKLLAARYRHRAPWETPREWIETARATLTLADATPLLTLAALYIRAIYSTRPMQEDEGEAANAALSALSWQKAE